MIVGNLANTVTLGGYSGDPTNQVDAVQGITQEVKAANPNANIYYDSCNTSTTATAPASCSPQTLSEIKSADLVVVFAGTDENVADEGHDRTTLAMPGNYDSMIQQVAAVGNPRMLLAIQSDGPVQIYDVQHYFPAILFSGYNGEAQGQALADVIFGGRTRPAIWTSPGTRTTASCRRSRTTASRPRTPAASAAPTCTSLKNRRTPSATGSATPSSSTPD